MGEGFTFSTGPLATTMEITGPVAAKLLVSSSTSDADLFLILRVFAPDGSEVTFQGAQDPHTPIAQGWLRASHRKLDAKRSLPYRPFHTHDEAQPLTPGEPVELDIEIWPTCVVVPAGYSVALTIRGKDYEYGGAPVVSPHVPYPLRGVGPFIHADPRNRSPEIYGGKNTLHFNRGRQPWVMLPIIPPT
jgi:predicted acyl esterase